MEKHELGDAEPPVGDRHPLFQQPAELGHRRDAAGPLADPRRQARVAGSGEPGGHVLAPGVEPGRNGSRRLAVPHGGAALGEAGDPDGGHRVPLPHCRQDVGDRVLQRAGGHLDGTVSLVDERRRHGGAAPDGPGAVDHDRLGPAGADVETEEERGRHPAGVAQVATNRCAGTGSAPKCRCR